MGPRFIIKNKKSIHPILDKIFGKENHLADFIWPRRSVASPFRGVIGPKETHDTILYYSNSSEYVYNPQFEETRSDEHGKYVLTSLFIPISEYRQTFVWRDLKPPGGRTWRYSLDRLNELDKAGKIQWTTSGSYPRLKRYLDEDATTYEIGSTWNDISDTVKRTESLKFINSRPLALMERIIKMGSNVSDLFIDPFCGAGSSIIAAQNHGRRWFACDRSPESYKFTLRRLEESCGLLPRKDFQVGDQSFLEANFPVIQKINRSVLDKFVLGEMVKDEETLYCEFKEIKGSKAVESIKNISDEYVVAFLNREGGRIYWGIRDSDRVVVGVQLNDKERNEVSRVVTEKLTNIRPAIAVSNIRIQLHPVYQNDQPISDLCVVEIEGCHTECCVGMCPIVKRLFLTRYAHSISSPLGYAMSIHFVFTSLLSAHILKKT